MEKQHTVSNEKPLIGISLGDLNGIGTEVILKTLSSLKTYNEFVPIIYGSSKVLGFYRKLINLNDFYYHQAKNISQINPKKPNVINLWDEPVQINPGSPSPESGEYAFKSLKGAVQDLKEGKIQALVTAPIDKLNIQSEEFQFHGHTEYLTRESGQSESLMLLVSESLRVGTVTGHIPLSRVASVLSSELIQRKLSILEKSLKKDFMITKPRIAVLGLNPHAGENGLLGKEDMEMIKPLIENQRKAGKLIFGPFPADGFFGKAEFTKYDAVLSMYHDQGLIPFKTLAFDRGVNYTAGLTFIRTSPDHGTAYDIAGKGIADETSFREAVYLALDIIKHREESELGKKDLIAS